MAYPITEGLYSRLVQPSVHARCNGADTCGRGGFTDAMPLVGREPNDMRRACLFWDLDDGELDIQHITSERADNVNCCNCVTAHGTAESAESAESLTSWRRRLDTRRRETCKGSGIPKLQRCSNMGDAAVSSPDTLTRLQATSNQCGRQVSICRYLDHGDVEYMSNKRTHNFRSYGNSCFIRWIWQLVSSYFNWCTRYGFSSFKQH
jgi:hypothetical protein